MNNHPPSDDLEGSENTQSANPQSTLLLKKQPPHLRAQKILKVQSPSDVLSPFSQKIMAERNSALKSLKPKSLTDTLLSMRQSQLRQNSDEAATSSSLSAGEEATMSASRTQEKPFQADKVTVNPEQEEGEDDVIAAVTD